MINLPNVTIGSLLFPTGSSLTITNNAPATAAGNFQQLRRNLWLGEFG